MSAKDAQNVPEGRLLMFWEGKGMRRTALPTVSLSGQQTLDAYERVLRNEEDSTFEAPGKICESEVEKIAWT